MWRFWQWSLTIAVPAAIAVALLNKPMAPPPPVREDRRFTTPDGRSIAYEIRGDLAAKHVVFWNHGIISSRHAPEPASQTVTDIASSQVRADAMPDSDLQSQSLA